MALAEPTVGDRGLDPGRQLEQSEGVGHGRAGSTDPRRDLVLAQPEVVDQLAIGVGGLERIEILALEVLDEGELELIAIGELPHDGRDPLETGRLGGAKAALAGDELVAIDRFGDEDRLEDAVLRDARGQRRQSLGIEALPGLMRVGLDPRGRDLDR